MIFQININCLRQHERINMRTADIMLTTIKAVRDFVDIIGKYDLDVDLSSGRYIVDAKSIMGIFSLDLLKPITLTARGSNENEMNALFGDIEQFMVK